MPNPAIGVAGAGMLSGALQSRSASKAAGAQSSAASAGMDEQHRQFDEIQKLLAPYVQTGTSALGGQENLLGMKGAEAQQAAIQGLDQSPVMQAMLQQGENAMLQNASATGGLRGGNLQGAMAQFRPQLLAQMIQQQYANLGGLSQMGQASAAQQAAFGQQTGANVGNLMQQRGAAQAGGELAQGKFLGSIPGIVAGGFGGMGAGGFGGMGGSADVVARLNQTNPINPTAGFTGWTNQNTIGGVFN
jgi:hypothetical protein